MRKKTDTASRLRPKQRTEERSEPLPDLPTENVKQFIGRMKKDYDLTSIMPKGTKKK